MDDEMQLIADCEARESRLSDWERGFIDSIKSQIEDGKSLTPKQCDRLNTIWDRVTSRG